MAFFLRFSFFYTEFISIRKCINTFQEKSFFSIAGEHNIDLALLNCISVLKLKCLRETSRSAPDNILALCNNVNIYSPRISNQLRAISQVFVGVVSSLIVIPVNLIVVQIFRSVRPKPVKVKHRKTNPSSTKILLNRDGIDTYGRLKDAHSNNGSDNSVNSIQDKKSRLSINDVHTDMDRASFTSSPLLHERKMSPDLDDELGKNSSMFFVCYVLV